MNIRMRSFCNRMQSILFAALIFLIPSNLFFILDRSHAYVHGILVDYLLPKLFLSDIVIVALLLCWIAERFLQKSSISMQKIRSISIFFFGFLVFCLVQLFTSRIHAPEFLSGTVASLFKMCELIFFFFWVTEHREIVFSKTSIRMLAITILFQSIVGLYQYHAQRSFLGYMFLGESNLSVASSIAKSNGSGALRILPYGTTPHPNVLAGFLVISLLILAFFLQQKTRTQEDRAWNGFILLCCLAACIVLFFIESLTALTALTVGMALFLFQSRIHRLNQKKLILKQYATVAWMFLITTAIGILLFFSIVSIARLNNTVQSLFTAPSIARRAQLQSIAFRMIAKAPLTGVGLSQFPTQMERFGSIPGAVRFLQPVHHVGLLWLAETGIVGLLFLTLLFLFVHFLYSIEFKHFFVLASAILLLASLDHYLFSLQQGNLVLIFACGFLLKKKEIENSEFGISSGMH